MAPSSLTQVVIWLLALVPGIVYRAARMRSVGASSRDIDASHRVLGAFVASVVFVASYLLLLGDPILDLLTQPLDDTNLPMIGVATLAGCVVLPALIGSVANILTNVASRQKWLDFRGWQSSPDKRRVKAAKVIEWIYMNAFGRFTRVTPWDLRVPGLGGNWVRIRKHDGVFLMGFLSTDAGYVATYPDRPSLFLSPQATVCADGTFKEITADGRGLWYELEEGDMVEFIGESDVIPSDSDSCAGSEPEQGEEDNG